jgi:hypothetical protein
LTPGAQKKYPLPDPEKSGAAIMPKKRFPHSNGSAPHKPLHDDLLLPDPVRQEESSPAELMAARPEIYQKCVDYLESGMSPGGVSALTGVSIALVRKIRNSLGSEILHAAIRQTGRNLVEVSQQMSERLLIEGHKIPIAQIPQSLSMMVDKWSHQKTLNTNYLMFTVPTSNSGDEPFRRGRLHTK